MTEKISFLIFCFLNALDKIFQLTIKKSFLPWLNYFIQKKSYKYVEIDKKKIYLFAPNALVDYRVNTFFSKEPETLEWINSFKNEKDFIFWDIGANVGLYSIYNAVINHNSKTIAFEPSSSNLRILTRNISINNLENKISIFQFPLSDKENKFQMMNEPDFIEGGALNSFGEKINFEGKKFNPQMKYNIFGTNINYLLNSKILEIPDFIKLDVDGIEHLILEGANKYLNNKKIKSISVEINENYTIHHEKILNILKTNNFNLLHKKNSLDHADINSKHYNTFNYVFIR